jgi:hypothetical protein
MTWLAAGAARTWGVRQVGRPSSLFQALGVAELGLGAALLAVPRRRRGA